MSNSIFDATILGGGNKAISLSVLKKYYTDKNSSRILIETLTDSDTFSLSKTKVYTSQDTTNTETIEFNTLFIDQKNINCKYKAEDKDTYIIIPDKNLKDNSGTNSITISNYFSNTDGKIIIMEDDEKRNELLNEMLFDATSIRGGTRAVSITHPKLSTYLKLKGVLYLEKEFNTQDINKFVVKNDSVVINNSIHIKSIDLFDKLDFSDENKHGMLLDVVNSKYYTKDNKSGKDIYSNPGNYSECVKYLYSSNVNTKDLQVLSLLNDYNTLRTIKDDNDLYKIKFLLFLICDALRIPRKYI